MIEIPNVLIQLTLDTLIKNLAFSFKGPNY